MISRVGDVWKIREKRHHSWISLINHCFLSVCTNSCSPGLVENATPEARHHLAHLRHVTLVHFANVIERIVIDLRVERLGTNQRALLPFFNHVMPHGDRIEINVKCYCFRDTAILISLLSAFLRSSRGRGLGHTGIKLVPLNTLSRR